MTDQTSVTYSLPVVEWEQVKACQYCAHWELENDNPLPFGLCDYLYTIRGYLGRGKRNDLSERLFTPCGFYCRHFQPKDDL